MMYSVFIWGATKLQRIIFKTILTASLAIIHLIARIDDDDDEYIYGKA
jgi:hypothetical protein